MCLTARCGKHFNKRVVSLEGRQWTQATFPVKEGGSGLRSSKAVANAAYVGSRAAAHALCIAIWANHTWDADAVGGPCDELLRDRGGLGNDLSSIKQSHAWAFLSHHGQLNAAFLPRTRTYCFRSTHERRGCRPRNAKSLTAQSCPHMVPPTHDTCTRRPRATHPSSVERSSSPYGTPVSPCNHALTRQG